MNLLAIDPGSKALGLACFVEGERTRTDLIRPKASMPWLERLGYIANELHRGTEAWEWGPPDVVAIEKVVAHKNVSSALTQAMTVGYLARVLDEIYPRCQWVEVSKAEICHLLGLKGNARRADVKAAARARFPELGSEDECDAAAIGLAALKEFASG